jgi:asparagine synthase (glutamine-hydrolysing)
MLGNYDSIGVFEHYYDRAETDDLLSRIQYVDIKTYLPDDILTKVDRASMAVSLEVRAPLLDHQLMERLASMPSSLKLRGRTGKYILKKAMEKVLPNDILYRRKQGFAVPLDHWFRNELKELAQESLFRSNDGIFDVKFLQKIWEQHQSRHYDRSAHLWAILMFRKWQETFGT